jgi:glycosyltransferase involved in cell wall biosynthesis
MISKPFVSIIMPAYNAEQYIGESIESVRGQTFQNWEMIIIDDGSSDNTASVVKTYAAQDGRIQYIWQKNERQGKARNTGISISKGEYLAFLDADDIWLSQKLERQLDLIEKTKADLVFSSAYVFEKSPFERDAAVLGTGDVCYNGTKAIEVFFEGNKLLILTVLLKKKAVKEVDGFNEDPEISSAEDYHLWLKLLIRNNVFQGSSEILAAYRILPGSSSASDRLSSIASMAALRNIAISFPEFETKVKTYYKSWIKKTLGLIRSYTRQRYFNIQKINLVFIGYSAWLPFIRFFDILFGRNFSIRLSYFILNYL